MAEPFRFPNGQLAYSVEDLKKICEQSPQDSTHYLIQGDFENWLDYIGNSQAAQKAREARQANLNESERLEKFLKSLTPAPAVAPKPQPTPAAKTVNKTPEKPAENDNPFIQFFQKLFGG
ncbi:hypothetical protein PCC7424_1505 [Gloeothece citriformis PCC 7424]|uniref:Uncharacterized protein n=1 Tax=Gloeothece citriformis (strain PCC 7424) TaxID=65393 RepID=B7K9H8_GLOC7|nr:hypothetical protein [Gloeothece citriformis]ACK69946.1 hypothetical protein PCC7424_1505 [Gloeothece citriformis PCC 7424]